MTLATHNVLFLASSYCLMHATNAYFLPKWRSFSSRCHCEVINTKTEPLTGLWGAGWDAGHPQPGWVKAPWFITFMVRNLGWFFTLTHITGSQKSVWEEAAIGLVQNLVEEAYVQFCLIWSMPSHSSSSMSCAAWLCEKSEVLDRMNSCRLR